MLPSSFLLFLIKSPYASVHACRRPRSARRPRARDRALAFRSGDRLSVLARSTRRSSAGIRGARSTASPTCSASASSRTNGCAAGRCSAGCQGPAPASRSYVFETGGTTGMPKTRVACEDFRTDYELFSDDAARRVLSRRASNWLMLGPSGPRRLRLAVEHLAQYRGGICFCVDLDPRWVIKLIKKGWMRAPRRPTRIT